MNCRSRFDSKAVNRAEPVLFILSSVSSFESNKSSSENLSSVLGFGNKNQENGNDITRVLSKALSKNWPAVKKQLEFFGAHLSKGKLVNAITNFCRKNGGNVMLTGKFARHVNLQTTMTYIQTEREELYRSIRNSQEGGILEKVRRMHDDLLV